MRIHHGHATVKSGAHVSIENVSSLVQQEVSASGIATGFAMVTVPHTTCGLVVNEDERGLKADIKRLVEELLAPLGRGGGFQHDCIDDNAQAHLTSILLGHAVTVPVGQGRLSLGTWQSIFLIEMDGPRTRRLSVQVFGE